MPEVESSLFILPVAGLGQLPQIVLRLYKKKKKNINVQKMYKMYIIKCTKKSIYIECVHTHKCGAQIPNTPYSYSN